MVVTDGTFFTGTVVTDRADKVDQLGWGRRGRVSRMQFVRRWRRSTLFAVGGGNVAVLLLGVVSGAIASRGLGPTLRGELVVAQTWAGTVSVVLTLGVTQAVVTYAGSDDELPRPLLLQSGVAFTVGFGTFTVLAVSGTQNWINWYGIFGGAALTAGSLISSNSAGLAQRYGRMTREFQRVRLIPQALGLVAAVCLWLAGIRATNVWLITLGLAILLPSCVIMISLLGGRQALKAARTWLPSRLLVRRAASAFVLVVGSTVIYRIDSLFVAAWLPSEEVALYAVAVAAAGACATVGQAVGMIVFSELRGIIDRRQQRAVICRGTARALVATSVVAIPLFLVAPRAIQIVYGAAFVPAAGATRLLVVASVPLAADYLLVHALLVTGAGRRVFHVQTFAVLLTVALLMAALPSGKIVLVALVSVSVYIVSAVLLFAAAMRGTATP